MYKIEITAETLAELSGKVLSLASKLMSGTATEGRPATKPTAGFAVPDFAIEMQDGNVVSITPLEIEEVLPEEIVFAPEISYAEPAKEVAEAAPVDPTPAPKSAPVATATESQPTTTEPSSTPAPAELNFDTDVAPHVLALVKEKDKATAQEILSQFGVEKASLLDPARWPELVTALKDAM